jgi:hypothetical protein
MSSELLLPLPSEASFLSMIGLTARGRNFAIIPCAADLTSGLIGALSATTVNKKLKKKLKKFR